MTEQTETVGPDDEGTPGTRRRKQRVVIVKSEGCCAEGEAEVEVKGCCGGGDFLWQSASGAPLLEAIETALTGREFGVSVRVSEDVLAKLDVLVEAGICESRSAAATFLVREGIEANADLFTSVEATTRKIAELKESLRARIGALGKEA